VAGGKAGLSKPRTTASTSGPSRSTVTRPDGWRGGATVAAISPRIREERCLVERLIAGRMPRPIARLRTPA